MVQAFPFSGIQNFDDPDEVIPAIHHRELRNGWFKGTTPNLRLENVPGTRQRTNPFLINDNNNLTIGKYYDPIGKRIFVFNYRGDNSKAIYMYDTILGIWYRLIEQGVNADNDVLGFTQTPIINIDIIYGDSTQGDILYFIDSFGVPKKLNVQRAIAGGYGTIKKSYLDVSKEPPSIPPPCVYENDSSNTVNNLRKKQFKAKLRWVFDDQDKSVTSSQSEVAIPLGVFDQSFDSDPTKNCRLAIIYQTGAANVKKIEILMAVSLGVVFSDYFLVASIDKSVTGLSDNDLGTYLFYNDKAYNYIDVEESIQLFDYVPQTAGAQTLLNGNVLSYGNIKEGYPNLTNFSFNGNTSSILSSERPYYYGNLFSVLVSNQSGDSGFGSDNIHIIVRGIISAPSFSLDTYTVYMTDGSTVTYTLNTNDDSAAIIAGLRTDAIGKGYTIISSGNNDLIITKSAISLARTFITSNYSYNVLAQTSFNAYDWLGKHGWGLVYFDQKERTNGVVYTDGFSVNSASYTESGGFANKPSFNASIYHVPPDWAYYYQWVRTKDLKKSSSQQWVSDRTYKDLISLSGITKYAYISIQSLNVFKAANPQSPLGYSFTAGDRITFMKRFNPDNTTANIYGNSKDFEIVSSVVDPIINGETRTGQFVKIILPSTDGSFDFGEGFFNYFIELYTPAQSVANGLDVYMEFGERYMIGNPTLSTRFHQGMLQNQTTDHLTPATFEFNKGDFYIKNRSVQTGNEFLFNVPENTVTGADFIIVGINFLNSTYPDSNITTQNQAYVGMPSFNPFTDGRWFLGAVAVTDFHIKGSITWNFSTAQTGSAWDLYIQNRFGEKLYLVSENVEAAGSYTFSFDTYTTLEDDHIFLLAQGSAVRTIKFLSSNITFTIDKVISQVMIDKNFSDYYPSSVNSNGRAFVYSENANQVTFPVNYRWSLAYQSDTNINKSNRFYAQNFDSADRRYGSIQRMLNYGKLLTFFQERRCGQAGIYQKFITDNTGGTQLITTTNIITENNIQYYAGDYGVGNQSDSVVQSGFVYYFADPIRGVICRLSRDGITVLSEVYKMQTYAGRTIPNYLTSRNYTFGGVARITGAFNVRKDNTSEYLCVLQPWTYGSDSFVGETLAFDEGRNAFYSFFDFAPEHLICAENVLYSFRNGRMFIHDQTAAGTMNTFYGTKYETWIKRVFNEPLMQKKSWISVTEQASVIWDCPEISTNQYSYGTTAQQSNLITDDFNLTESQFNAAFLNDSNSIGGIAEGDTLKGSLIKIKFRLRTQDSGNPNFLAGILIKYIDSPYNSK